MKAAVWVLPAIAMLMAAGVSRAEGPLVLRDGEELQGRASFVEIGEWDDQRERILMLILEQPRCLTTADGSRCGRWVQVRLVDARKLAELREASALQIAARYVAPKLTDIGDIVAEDVIVKFHSPPGVIDYF